MPALANSRHEAFAQALARGLSASAAYGEAGFRPHRANAATLARKKHISVRVAEIQAVQLAIHQQATAEAAANAKVTLESLIAEAEAARIKAMSERGGAAAAVSALTAKAKLAGMWRDKVDQHNTGLLSIHRTMQRCQTPRPNAKTVAKSLRQNLNSGRPDRRWGNFQWRLFAFRLHPYSGHCLRPRDTKAHMVVEALGRVISSVN
jgi:hypothetical protein